MRIGAISSKNYSFKGNNTLRNTCFALAATTLLAGSCKNNNNNIDNLPTQNSKLEDNLNNDTNIDQEGYAVYHFYPTEDNSIDMNNYAWRDKVRPDKYIERDSAGYKILIAPNGERTVTFEQEDDSGNKITTTKFPNGKMIIKTEYNLEDPKEILYTESTYNADSVLIEHKYYNKIPSQYDSDDFTIEQSHEIRNDKGIVLSWESNIKDPERNEENNKYDHLSRLVYDDLKDEHYIYDGISRIPKKSYSVYEGCKRITLYNEDGSIEKVYFKASDGTITE